MSSRNARLSARRGGIRTALRAGLPSSPFDDLAGALDKFFRSSPAANIGVRTVFTPVPRTSGPGLANLFHRDLAHAPQGQWQSASHHADLGMISIALVTPGGKYTFDLDAVREELRQIAEQRREAAADLHNDTTGWLPITPDLRPT